MTPRELFEQLEHPGNDYSYFKRGSKFIKFSTGGWSANEALISKLEKEFVFNMLLAKWEKGGHYTFKVPSKKIMDIDI